MKKASRDYRRSRRKKWIIINSQIVKSAMCAAIGAFQVKLISEDSSLSNQEKSIKIAQQVIHTAQKVAESFNPSYYNPQLDLIQNELSKIILENA